MKKADVLNMFKESWMKKLSKEEFFQLKNSCISICEKMGVFIDYMDTYEEDNRAIPVINAIKDFFKLYAQYKEADLIKLRNEYKSYSVKNPDLNFPLLDLRKDEDDYHKKFTNAFIEKYPNIYQLYSKIDARIDVSLNEKAGLPWLMALDDYKLANMKNWVPEFIEKQKERFARINTEKNQNNLIDQVSNKTR